MTSAPLRLSPERLPRPDVPARVRSQVEAFLVIRRNILELWGEGAYRAELVPSRFLGRKQVLVNAPEGIRHVLVTNAQNYTRNASTLRVLRPILGRGLFLAEGEAWKMQRRTIAPAMSPRMMPMLAGQVIGCVETALDALGQAHGIVHLATHFQNLALAIAAQSMFSLEADRFGAELRRRMMAFGERLAQPGLLDIVLPPRFTTPGDLGRRRFRRDWLAMMDRIIDRREALGPPPGEARDLYDLLAAARDPETGEGFGRAQLRDEVSTMIVAGHETTAAALFWAAFVAARLPAAQDAIAAEAGALDLSPSGAGAALRHLVITRAFVDEVLRLYPPAFLLVRMAREADIIAGHRIAAGTVVSIAPWILHRHRQHWSEPESFDAGRFLPSAPAPDRFTYLPFGAGPRVCVGAQFALTEAVLVLARLFQRFRVRLAGETDVRPLGRVTTQPDRPVPFMLERRG